MAISAPIIGTAVSAVAAVGGTTYAAVNANQQRIAGERQASAQQGAQEQQIANQKSQQDAATQQASAQALAAQNKRQQASTFSTGAGAQGFGGTILTSPLGIPGGDAGTSASGGRTLLGG